MIDPTTEAEWLTDNLHLLKPGLNDWDLQITLVSHASNDYSAVINLETKVAQISVNYTRLDTNEALVSLLERIFEKVSRYTPRPTNNHPSTLPNTWELTFEDTFNSFDSSKWIKTFSNGVRHHPSNNELMWYWDENVVCDGNLKLTARIQNSQNEYNYDYSSGIVTGAGKFSQKYGYFEARIKVPAGQGLWPAFWLVAADGVWPPEIDVLEVLGHEPHRHHMNNHYLVGETVTRTGKSWVGPDFSQDFHTFAIEWQQGLIIWYVNGLERFRSTSGVPDKAMYMLLNLAVGGDWPGAPDETTPFPSTMEIEWVRVWKKL